MTCFSLPPPRSGPRGSGQRGGVPGPREANHHHLDRAGERALHPLPPFVRKRYLSRGRRIFSPCVARSDPPFFVLLLWPLFLDRRALGTSSTIAATASGFCPTRNDSTSPSPAPRRARVIEEALQQCAAFRRSPSGAAFRAFPPREHCLLRPTSLCAGPPHRRRQHQPPGHRPLVGRLYLLLRAQQRLRCATFCFCFGGMRAQPPMQAMYVLHPLAQLASCSVPHAKLPSCASSL